MCFSGALSIIRDLLALPPQDKTAISSFIVKYLSPWGQIRKVQKTARVHGKDRVRGHYLPV